jgi:outer membrane protein
VRKRCYRKQPLLSAMALAILCSGTAAAEAENAEPVDWPEDGFTWLSDARNVTHWRLGAGLGVRPSPYEGDRMQYLPIPLLVFLNKWTHVATTKVDLRSAPGAA